MTIAKKRSNKRQIRKNITNYIFFRAKMTKGKPRRRSWGSKPDQSLEQIRPPGVLFLIAQDLFNLWFDEQIVKVLPWIQHLVTLLTRICQLIFLEWNQNRTSELCCFFGKGLIFNMFLHQEISIQLLIIKEFGFVIFLSAKRGLGITLVDQIWEEVFDHFPFSSVLIFFLYRHATNLRK